MGKPLQNPQTRSMTPLATEHFHWQAVEGLVSAVALPPKDYK